MHLVVIINLDMQCLLDLGMVLEFRWKPKAHGLANDLVADSLEQLERQQWLLPLRYVAG